MSTSAIIFIKFDAASSTNNAANNNPADDLATVDLYSYSFK